MLQALNSAMFINFGFPIFIFHASEFVFYNLDFDFDVGCKVSNLYDFCSIEVTLDFFILDAPHALCSIG